MKFSADAPSARKIKHMSENSARRPPQTNAHPPQAARDLFPRPPQTHRPGETPQTPATPEEPELVHKTQDVGAGSGLDSDSEEETHAAEEFIQHQSAEEPLPDTDDEALTQHHHPEDLGENAHHVVTALLGHQQDLVYELRSVYDRLEQVRTVDHAALEQRLAEAESVIARNAEHTSDAEQQIHALSQQVDQLATTVAEHSQTTQAVTEQLREATDRYSAQLAERDARISAQNAKIDELEAAVTAAVESSTEAHQKVQVLAEETGSSLTHRISERVSPAAQQAKSALGNIAKRLRR